MRFLKSTLLPLHFFLIISLTSFTSGGPDLLVKIVRDDLVKSKKCTLGVFKNGNFKSMDDKYKILSFDFYVLNHRGETKYYATMEKAEVDLAQQDGLEIVKGDLIVIENIQLIHAKSGEGLTLKRITERYLVR